MQFQTLQLNLDLFFIKLYREPLQPPSRHFVIVLYNLDFNLYKEQIVEMKHNLESNCANATPKWQCVKEVEKKIILEDVETINFYRCMHNMI